MNRGKEQDAHLHDTQQNVPPKFKATRRARARPNPGSPGMYTATSSGRFPLELRRPFYFGSVSRCGTVRSSSDTDTVVS